MTEPDRPLEQLIEEFLAREPSKRFGSPMGNLWAHYLVCRGGDEKLAGDDFRRYWTREAKKFSPEKIQSVLTLFQEQSPKPPQKENRGNA